MLLCVYCAIISGVIFGIAGLGVGFLASFGIFPFPELQPVLKQNFFAATLSLSLLAALLGVVIGLFDGLMAYILEKSPQDLEN